MDISQHQTLGDDELYDFLKNAPKYFREGERIKKFQLKNGDYIHCVLWNYHFYITGTDIVKILVWRFQNSGRQLGNMKKFEEGAFSDLRNLKPGIDATLEGPRSEFLEFLYKNGCIRTQKKQKVFYWYSVPHDALFCDAMERDLRRDTSMYSYNTFSNDRKQPFADMQYSNRKYPSGYNFSQKASSLNFNKPYQSGDISLRPVVSPKNDIFNIKNTLFGDLTPQKPHYRENSKFCGVLNDEPSQKIFPLPFETKNSKPAQKATENYEDESKMNRLKSKIGEDLKRKFDDFDLDQLGFLKERCCEYNQLGCEKKSLNERNQESSSKNLASTAKVSFIGMGNSDMNE